jgi:ubiquinone/menaquinone biosynthesis C-methylase UbiE
MDDARTSGREETTLNQTEHWDAVYRTKAADRLSWYAPHLAQSLALIDEAHLPADAAVIDVGAGTSTLPADLLDRGLRHITVLDIAPSAVAQAKKMLGERADQVQFVVGDVTQVSLPERAYDLWHDRAVFHFLTDQGARDAYIAQVTRALKPGGHVVIGTFGKDGPAQCSGLDVAHYDDAGLQDAFGVAFERMHCLEHTHVTPWGSEQEFVYCLCRRTAA